MLSIHESSPYASSHLIREVHGTIYSAVAPVSHLDIVLAYVGAAATNSIVLVLISSRLAAFRPDPHPAPGWMVPPLVLHSGDLLPGRFVIASSRMASTVTFIRCW